ncbi:carbohydrate-binding module family 50 protein [Stipitochalara longipes BDJ]|nr:carbohydrate-binding module family 50 protein [Stipitochalara longipes BDJ]
MGFASSPLLVLGLLTPQLTAALALQPRQVSCDFSTAANSGDTCLSFSSEWGLTVAAFEALNPGIICPTLVAGTNYCVIGTPAATTSSSSTTTITTKTSSKATTTSTTKTSSKATTTSTTKTTSSKTSTATTTTSSLPSPTQPGLASNCNNFHQVASGESCSGIEAEYGIPAATFSTWNPAIDSACDNLFLGYYVCVGIPGFTPTPTPQMPDIIATCNKYHLVALNDGCSAIETSNGITSAEFLAWNPSVDTACDNLWLGYYVCIGVSA